MAIPMPGPYQVSQTIQEVKLAYFAGLFDGEGCIAAYMQKAQTRSGHRYPCASLRALVSMTDPRPLREFQKVFGGSLVSKAPKYQRKRVIWEWCLGSAAAGKFLRAIIPYLIVKKEQAELALELRERIDAYIYKTNGCYGNTPLTHLEIEARRKLVDSIKELKQRQVA